MAGILMFTAILFYVIIPVYTVDPLIESRLNNISRLLNETRRRFLLYFSQSPSCDCDNMFRACGTGHPIYSTWQKNFSWNFLHYPQTQTHIARIGYSPNSSSHPNCIDTGPASCLSSNHVQSIWRENVLKMNNLISWQYFASELPLHDNSISAEEGLLSIFPARPWNCSQVYDVASRPYYTASTTGKKDVVILLDVSTVAPNVSGRMALALPMVNRILLSLTRRDFIAILPYAGSVSSALSSRLIPATATNLAELQKQLYYFNRYRDDTTKVADLALAMQQALKYLHDARANNYGANCSQSIVLLTSGVWSNSELDSQFKQDDLTPSLPNMTQQNNSNVVVFSFVIAPKGAPVQRLVPSKLACQSKGPLRIVRNMSDAVNASATFIDYFRTLLGHRVPESITWTWPHTSYFDVTNIVTASILIDLPIRRRGEHTLTSRGEVDVDWDGVYTENEIEMDIDTDTDNGLLQQALVQTNDEVIRGTLSVDIPVDALLAGTNTTMVELNELLLRNQTCTSLDQRNEQQANIIQELQGEACAYQTEYNTTRKLDLRIAKPFLVILSVALTIILVVIPIIYCLKCANVAIYHHGVVPIPCTVCLWFIFAFIALLIFWAQVYNDIIVQQEFDQVSFVVEDQHDFQYRCCKVVDCACRQAPKSVGKCSDMRRNLTEGVCNNGYYCCDTDCTTNCDGGNPPSCTTDCWCSSEVSRQKCRVECGICHKLSLDLTYTHIGQVHFTKVIKNCGLNDTSCVKKYFQSHPIGQERQGYVDPQYPKHVVMSNKLRARYFAPFIIFAILMVFPLIGICIFTGFVSAVISCSKNIPSVIHTKIAVLASKRSSHHVQSQQPLIVQVDSSDPKLCCVCMDHPISHAFVPCGHQQVCQACSESHQWTTCPLCRQNVEKIIKIY